MNAVLRVTAELAAIMLQAGTISGGAASAAQQLGQWNNGVPASQYWQMLPSVPIYPVLLVVADFVGKFRVHPLKRGTTWSRPTGRGLGPRELPAARGGESPGFAAMTDVKNWMQDRLDNAWTEYTNNPPTGYTQFKVYYEANARLEAIDSHGPKSLLLPKNTR